MVTYRPHLLFVSVIPSLLLYVWFVGSVYLARLNLMQALSMGTPVPNSEEAVELLESVELQKAISDCHDSLLVSSSQLHACMFIRTFSYPYS